MKELNKSNLTAVSGGICYIDSEALIIIAGIDTDAHNGGYFGSPLHLKQIEMVINNADFFCV
jgi:hypothetical protein